MSTLTNLIKMLSTPFTYLRNKRAADAAKIERDNSQRALEARLDLIRKEFYARTAQSTYVVIRNTVIGIQHTFPHDLLRYRSRGRVTFMNSDGRMTIAVGGVNAMGNMETETYSFGVWDDLNTINLPIRAATDAEVEAYNQIRHLRRFGTIIRDLVVCANRLEVPYSEICVIKTEKGGDFPVYRALIEHVQDPADWVRLGWTGPYAVMTKVDDDQFKVEYAGGDGIELVELDDVLNVFVNNVTQLTADICRTICEQTSAPLVEFVDKVRESTVIWNTEE